MASTGGDTFIDYYALLGIKPTASAEEIRTAFLTKAKQHHPDAGGSDNHMQLLTAAYRTLKTAASKSAYDMMHNFHTGTTQLSDYRYADGSSGKNVEDMSDKQLDDFLDSLYNEYHQARPAQKPSIIKRILKPFI